MAGEEVEFITTTKESGGAELVADVTMQPGAKGPMPHVHPIQQETFEILEGKARFRFGREKEDVAAGQTVAAEPGLAHGFSNPFDEPLKVRTTWTPASDLEHFFENLFGYASIGKTNSKGIPPLRQIALIMEAHPESGHPAIPKIIYKPIFKTLAVFGRWSGMSGSYPELCPTNPASEAMRPRSNNRQFSGERISTAVGVSESVGYPPPDVDMCCESAATTTRASLADRRVVRREQEVRICATTVGWNKPRLTV